MSPAPRASGRRARRCRACCRGRCATGPGRCGSRPARSGRARVAGRPGCRLRPTSCGTRVPPRRPWPPGGRRSGARAPARRRSPSGRPPRSPPAAGAASRTCPSPSARERDSRSCAIAARRRLQRARPVAVALARLEADRLRRALNRTVADRVLDGIRPDGSIPLRTLLQLTELAYGDVAGVTLPAGRPGGGAPDATVVLAALRERAAELSPAQRRAVEATVWPRVRQTGKRTRAVDPVTGCRDDTFGGAPDVGMTALARERRATIAASHPRLRRAADLAGLRLPVDGDRRDRLRRDRRMDQRDGRRARPSAPERSSTTTSNMCFVRVFPPVLADPGAEPADLLGHEMYHCLHKEWRARAARAQREPAVGRGEPRHLDRAPGRARRRTQPIGTPARLALRLLEQRTGRRTLFARSVRRARLLRPRRGGDRRARRVGPA